MKLKTILQVILFGMAFTACIPREELTITVSSDVLQADYIGNGVEWDPYDEAETWGSAVSEADWQKLFKRLDFMRMGYVRCMINSPYRYFDPATKKYDKTRNIESISRLLQYCTDHEITVIYGEYDGKQVLAAVNVSDRAENLRIVLPGKWENMTRYLYQEGKMKTDKNGYPAPVQTHLTLDKTYRTVLEAQTFILLTNIP